MKSPDFVVGTKEFLHKELKPGAAIVRIGRSDACEFRLTYQQLPGETIEMLFRRIACSLQQLKATPVLQFNFGSVPALREADSALRQVFGKPAWAVTAVDGAGCVDGGLAGVQMFAVSSRLVMQLYRDDRIIGCIYEAGGARHCLIGGLSPGHMEASKPAQAAEAFQQLESTLREAGFEMGDIVRTWFFLDDLLSWYNDFNAARTSVYNRHAFRSGSLPASTGVSARNVANAALALAAWAMQPLDAACRATEVLSPLQCPATEYRSSFSRAMEISTLEGRHLTISGTASIARDGTSVWNGDVRKQIELTMQVVEGILKSRGIGFADATRAIGYFKNSQDAMRFREWCQAQAVVIPGVIVRCDICRDDLLFEIELDAAAPA